MTVVGIGVDSVEVGRFRELLERQPAIRERLFTQDELSYAEKRNDQVPSLAVRFAAKEAAMKALGVGLGAFGFHDVEVEIVESGAPMLRLHRAAAELADNAGVVSWKVSLTHTCSVATAMVVAE